ncbi:hypothetical protein L3X38_036882 [Prunus dulcis]|uniref:Uncharacterized protein n=1 Tax=Prunus dulcis TaxID=3755 RepID=A0AAD4V225_PRUDU|nr:hypothetical protein L3X38_036882 [Prunus dulcis]
MRAPNIWILGLGPRWTIFEFSKYSNIGTRRTYLLPNFNSFDKNTSCPTSTPSAQLCLPKNSLASRNCATRNSRPPRNSWAARNCTARNSRPPRNSSAPRNSRPSRNSRPLGIPPWQIG